MANSQTGASAATPSAATTGDANGLPSGSLAPRFWRVFAWAVVAATFVFLINNYLTFWREWPGLEGLYLGQGDATLGWAQVGLYLIALAAVVAYVAARPATPLRHEAAAIYAISNFIIRAAFWSVLLVGLADMVISFLRVEGFLEGVFGAQMATDLSRSSYRGSLVHIPLIGVGIVIALFTRSLGFPWLALLVVVAEMCIVITRFVFSYEQAFMADLVRFWYAALFLFASAYTLFEEGHVRVDVLYAGFSDKTRGLVNAGGSVFLGMTLCAVVLAYGMGGKSTVINSPLLVFETSQTGFGMYVKYLMAGFLGVFAVTMMLHFAGYLLEAIADIRGDPDKRRVMAETAH